MNRLRFETYPDGYYKEFRYSTNPHQVKAFDEKGNETEYNYNSMGDLINVKLMPSGTIISEIQYDSQQRLKKEFSMVPSKVVEWTIVNK